MKARILIVDDHPLNLKLACDVLADAGYDIIPAADAEEASGLIRHTPPDLILMDIELPGMDGLSFTRQLKADPATRRIPVIAITAYAMKGDEEKAREAGCDDYISKPINTRTLGQRIARVLQQHQNRNEETDHAIGESL